MDKVPNFFLARTAAVLSVGWDPALKLLVSAQWNGWRVLHYRNPFDRPYREFRDNTGASLAHLKR